LENLTNETLAAKERELAEKERLLNAKQKKYAERDQDFSPPIRLAMTGAAQVLGFMLLIILGMFTFPSGQEDIARGLDFIKHCAICYLAISVLIPLGPLVYAYFRRRLCHIQVDIILLSYVASDLLILLFLVHQQGGLCRSMFLPVFFLIPTAYIIVERREPKFRWRRVVVLLAIVGCICRSYHVSLALMPPAASGAGQPVEGIVHLFWWSKQVTDFSTLAHWSYDSALFVASMISAFVPVVQIVIITVRDRFTSDELVPSSSMADARS